MNKDENKAKFDKLMLSIAKVVEASEADNVQKGDLDPVEMQKILLDQASAIKGIHACLSYAMDTMYNHMDGSKHLPSANSWEHMNYMQKQLGYGKEAAIRHAAYASNKPPLIIG